MIHPHWLFAPGLMTNSWCHIISIKFPSPSSRCVSWRKMTVLLSCISSLWQVLSILLRFNLLLNPLTVYVTIFRLSLWEPAYLFTELSYPWASKGEGKNGYLPPGRPAPHSSHFISKTNGYLPPGRPAPHSSHFISKTGNI